MKLVGLKGRIPVEPLDEERMTNLERRIVARAADAAVARPLRTPRFGLALGFAVAAVIAIGAGFAGWRLHGDRPGTPALAAGPVRVQTDAERSTLDIGDAVITSEPATEVTITRPGGGVLVTMKRGKVELDVGKRGGRPPLVVVAGETSVVVVGTRFSVDYGDGTGVAEVRVIEGIVRVERHQQEVRVAAGQAWTGARGVIALAELPVGRRTEPRGAVVAAAGETQPANGAGATIADPERAGSGAIEIDMGTAPDVLRDRVGAVPDARVPTAARGSNGSAASRPGGGTTRGGGAVGPVEVRPPAGATSAPRGKLAALIAKQPFTPALEVGPAPDGEDATTHAMKRYSELVVAHGAEESYAFYSMAVVQQSDARARRGDALSTLDAYFRRFPRTSEHHEAALWLRVRIQCLLEIKQLGNLGDRCRVAAAEYLRRAPDGRAKAIAELISGSR